MPITRDADFPVEIAQPLSAFNRCADGHSMENVVEAAGNMLSASLHNYAAAAGMTTDEAMAFAQNALRGVYASVRMNWQRQSQTDDVKVDVN